MKTVICFLLFLFSFPSQAQIVERVQAQIGKEMISFIDLKRFKKQLRLGLVSPSLLLKHLYKRGELLKDNNKLLDFMILREMLFQIAKKEKELPEIPKKEIENMVITLQGSLSKKRFARRLKRGKLNRESLKRQILIDLTNDWLLSRFVLPKAMTSKQDIESYHFNKYKKPLFKHFEYEFVSVSFTEDKKTVVYKKLKDKKADNLEKIALLLGLEHKTLKLKDEDIQSLFKAELEKLSVSQISPLLVIGDTYYILQLKWKQAQISPAEQQKKEKIEQTLYQTKLKKEMQQWITEQRASFPIIRHSL